MSQSSTILERLRWTIALALVVLAAAFAAYSAASTGSDAVPSVARSSWGTADSAMDVA
jgi:hypothetical protein